MAIQPFGPENGPENGMGDVVERYAAIVYGIALTHVKNRADADDVFQEVFLAFCRRNIRFNDEEHRKAWLIRTTINCCKKAVGNTWRKRTCPLEERSGPACTFVSAEENLVYAALCALPEKYRTVLQLFYYEELSAEEIGRALRLRAGTVRMRLTRGRGLMRDRLKEDYFDE